MNKEFSVYIDLWLLYFKTIVTLAIDIKNNSNWGEYDIFKFLMTIINVGINYDNYSLMTITNVSINYDSYF